MDATKPTQRNTIQKATAENMKPRAFVRRGLWLSAGLCVVGLLPVFLLLMAFLTYQALGLIMPGVQVAGMPLEGLTVDKAVQELDRVWNQEYRITAVDTQDPSRAWIVTPADFGLSVDALGTAMRAYSIGRGESIFSGAVLWLTGFKEMVEITPWVALDIDAARNALNSWARVVLIPPVEGDLSIQDGNVAQRSGQFGQELDVEASLALIVEDPTAILLDYQFIPLVTHQTTPDIMDVAETAAVLEELLALDITLSAYDPVSGEHFNWSPAREVISSWIELEKENGAYKVQLDEEHLAAYVEALDASLGPQRTFDLEVAQTILEKTMEGDPSHPLLIRYRPSEYVVQLGDNLVSIGFKVGMPYWRLLDENPVVAQQGLRVGETISIPPRDALLELPIVAHKRIVISIGEQRMWRYQDGELLAEHIVSTGIDRSPTLPGVFQVQAHIPNAYASIWDLTMPHFLGIYYATPDLLNGIHGLPLLSSGRRLWADVLGRPASYGCIILDLAAAEAVYNWAEDGVVVEIRQ